MDMICYGFHSAVRSMPGLDVQSLRGTHNLIQSSMWCLQEDAQQYEWAWANPLKSALLKPSKALLLKEFPGYKIATPAGKV